MSMTHVRRYEILLELEEAGEVEAVTAFIKIWRYENLLAHGPLTQRIRHELKILRADLLDAQIADFIERNPHFWAATLYSRDNIPFFAKSFRKSLDENRFAFSDILAAVTSRWESDSQ